MGYVYVSAVMQAPIDRTWAILRDFNGLPNYNSRLFSESYIEDGLPADRIGCVRNFKSKDGKSFIRERLLSLSDREYSCSYCILEAPLPVQNYVSEMKLRRVTEGDATFGEWWATFEVEPKNEAAVLQAVTDTFRFAFEGAEALARKGS
jgi:hypothetical protein